MGNPRSIRIPILVAVVVFAVSGLVPAPGRVVVLSSSAWAQDDFGFDFSDDDKKKKKKKKKKKSGKKRNQKAKTSKPKQGKPKGDGGETMAGGFDGLDVSVQSPEKAEMDKALNLMKDEDYPQAAAAFWDIYNNPKAQQYFQSAEYQLAKALYRMRLYHSALQHFGNILKKGPEHKYFRTSLEWLFFISHKIKDQREVLNHVARWSDIEFPKKYKDEFLFLLAKYFYFRALDLEKSGPQAVKKVVQPKKKTKTDDFGFDLAGAGAEDEGAAAAASSMEADFGLELDTTKRAVPTALPTDVVGFLSKAKAMILQIDEKSRFYPRGKYLEGIVLYKEANFQLAVDAFKQVVRILHPRTGKFRDDSLREMSFFQLARIHYEHKQFRYALFYYDRIDRDSLGWLEALFESSWAWFRLGKYQKALGNLITLDSPFFREEYFPEGLILKAVTYYENCRYPESNQIVKEFKDRYQPLHAELEKLSTGNIPPETYYNKLLAIQKAPPSGASGKLLRRILKLALADKDLDLLNSSVLEIDREIQRIRKKPVVFTRSQIAGRLLDTLQKRHVELIADAGQMTKRRLAQQRDFLGELISQALRIKLENDNAELEMLRKARAGELDLGPTLLTYDWSAATDDEKIYWPYEGEYWRDELGTYEYTLTWGCRKQVE